MSLFYLDKVTITPITIGATHGDKTEGVSFDSAGYFELENKIRRAQDGTPLGPTQFFILPAGTSIRKSDMIAAKTMNGIILTGDDAIRREVVQVFKARGIGISHIEVITESGRS